MKRFTFKHVAVILLCMAMLMSVVGCGGGVTFSINFIVDGEVYATIKTNGSETISLPDNPQKEGYRFVGWYWDEGTWEEPFSASSLLEVSLASSMNIYAHFKPLGNAGNEGENTDNGGTANPGGDHGGGSNGGNGTQQPPVTGEAIAVGQAYHMVMEQGNLNKSFYLTGTMDSYYLATTEDITAAPNFYFEKADTVEGQERFYLYAIVKGVKTYVNLYKNGTHTNFKLEAQPDQTVYYYDAAVNALVVICEGELMVLGSANDQSYTNVGPRMYTLAESSFVVKYVKSTQADQGADPTPPTVYTTPDEILDAANALGNNEYLSDQHAYTLSGIVLSVVTEWNAQYGNISVIILVDGTNGRTIECYRLSGEGAETLKVGDKITVKGSITRYVKIDDATGEILVDKVEFNYPTLESLESDFLPDTPDEILDAATALKENEYLANLYPFTLSGEIVEIISPWTEEYENIRVLILVDGTEGRTIECFRLSGEGTESLKLGDKITVVGPIKRYVNIDENGTTVADKIEFDYPVLIDVTSGGNGGDVVIYETPAEIMENAKLLAPGAYLSEGYAYTLSGVIQSVDVEYNAVNANISVTILVDGTNDTIQAFRMTGDTAILAELAIGDKITVKGPILMYQNASTGVVKLEFEGPTLEAYTKGEGSNIETPELEVLTPVVGTPYLFTLRQTNAGKIMYFNGAMDLYYLGTTEDKNAAVNVYIEETEGGYHLYFLTNGEKQYINFILSGTHVNPAIESTPTTVYTYDANLGTLTAPFNGGTWLFGTSASGTYLNGAARDASMENLVMQFTASDKVDELPEGPKQITIAEFIEIALQQPNRGEATAEKYIITGVVTNVENLIYGNITVTDETGSIYVYGVYDATGVNRFDAMEVQPKKGDTVTLLGVAGNYDRAQMQNGCVIALVPGENIEDDNIIYTTPEEIVNAAYALGANLYLSKGVPYTLTGEIISIDSAYNASYGNIIVTIVVGGMTDKPIYCYRLSGDGVENLKVGDTITVTGPIKNYVTTDATTGAVTQQTIEFEKPVLDSVAEEGDGVVIYDTLEEIFAAAENLAEGEVLSDGHLYTMSGMVVDMTAYNTEYDNINVTISVLESGNRTIYCFRLSGEDAASIALDDIITVTGKIKKYNGVVEFDYPTLVSRSAYFEMKFPVMINYGTSSLKEYVFFAGLTEIRFESFYNNIFADSLSFAEMCELFDITVNGVAANGQTRIKNGDSVVLSVKEYQPLNPTEGEFIVTLQVLFPQNEVEQQYSLIASAEANTLGELLAANIDTLGEVDMSRFTWVVDGHSADTDTLLQSGSVIVATICEEGSGVVIYNTPEEILDAAALLDSDTYLSDGYFYTMTGVVVDMAPYSTQYGNINVTIEIEGTNGLTIYCFRLAGEGADRIAIGDTITVTGKIKNYKGTVEFDCPSLENRVSAVQLKLYLDMNYGDYWLKQPLIYEDVTEITLAELYAISFNPGLTLAEMRESYDITVNGVAAEDTALLKAGDTLMFTPKEFTPPQPVEGEYSVTFTVQFPADEREQGYFLIVPATANTLSAMLEECSGIFGAVNMSIFNWTVDGEAANADTVLQNGSVILAVIK